MTQQSPRQGERTRPVYDPRTDGNRFRWILEAVRHIRESHGPGARSGPDVRWGRR